VVGSAAFPLVQKRYLPFLVNFTGDLRYAVAHLPRADNSDFFYLHLNSSYKKF
jgi:hypothetical protein